VLFGVRYLAASAGTLLMMVAMVAWASSLGLLIGAPARKEQQAVAYSLTAMIIFSVLGGTCFRPRLWLDCPASRDDPRVGGCKPTLRYSAAVGRRIQGAAVIAYTSARDFVRWNPHLHGIFLEGGFDQQGRFVHVPSVDLPRLAQYFRAYLSAIRMAPPNVPGLLARPHPQRRAPEGFAASIAQRIKLPTGL
jgi:hypothetical protein